MDEFSDSGMEEDENRTNNIKKPKLDLLAMDCDGKENNFKNDKVSYKNNSELEEGEVSDSSSSEEEFNDGYDDQLMGDEEDRARLASLTEKERETEIYKRIEQRELMKKRFEIEKKLRQQKKLERAKEKPNNKSKEKTTDKQKEKEKNSYAKEKIKIRENERKLEELDTSKLQIDFSSIDHKERSKERKKNIEENRGRLDKRVNAMAELKARREGKQKREEAEEERKRKEEEEKKKKEEETTTTQLLSKKNEVKLKASDIYSDDSDSDDVTNNDDKNLSLSNENVRARSRSPSDSRSRSSSSSSIGSDNDQDHMRTNYVPTKQDLNLIRLSRHKLERFVHLPFFDRIVKGCFIKIGIGQLNGASVYRAAEVIGAYETAKIYQLGNTRTNKGLKVRHGAQERVFRLEFASNQEFTDTEYQRWLDATQATCLDFPSKSHIEQKQADIKEAISYEFNEQDVDRIIKEKERFKPNPHNYAMKKTFLMKDRDAALARGDDETARRMSNKLSEIEERASELDKMRTSTISSISYINDRNRKRNVEEAEKAIREEVRANKGKKANDPFTRRSTKPRMNFKTGEKEALAAAEERRSQEESMVIVEIAKQVQPKKGLEKKSPQVSQEDLFSAHDFEIKIDLSLPAPATSVHVVPKSTGNNLVPKRSLNLQDYKKKRGLI